MGVAEGEDAGSGRLEAEREACDGGEGIRFPLGCVDGGGERSVAVFPEVGGQEILMACADAAVRPEESADVGSSVFDGCDAEVAGGAAVHFEMGGGGDVAEVSLEADPFSAGRSAAGGPYAGGFSGCG